MNDEEPEHQDGIAPAKSAYQYYSKENSTLVKDELLKEGKDTSLGCVVGVVSAKWKALPDEQRTKYTEMARRDRERYNHECALRDEEALREQEERRRANAVGEVTDTRMRGTTVQYTDALNQKAEAPKRTREVSELEKERKEAKKEAKRTEAAAVREEQEKMRKEFAAQAEARLKFLLSQSDIFSHFGSVKAASSDGPGSPVPGSSSSSSSSSKSKEAPGSARRSASVGGRSAGGAGSAGGRDDLDDDERAMAQEEEEDDDEQGGGCGDKPKWSKGSILTKQPSCIGHGTMRAYQLEGLNWMIRLQENGVNGILADEMGLGKTLQSISMLAFMHEFRRESGPHLVMVPKSTLSNWCNEFKRWCPVLRVLRFHGSREERQETIDTMLKPSSVRDDREWDVVITTYEIVNLERNALTKINWNYLIIDEAHRLKNEASQFSRTVRLLQTKYRLLLTGTPLQNNLHELWALLNFLLPDVFASSEQFDEWFNLDVDDQEAKQRMISQLHKLLRPFMLRRLKADVEKSLPPKSETILFTGMSAIQKNLYRQVLLRDIDTINGSAASNNSGSRTAILNIVMQLRKSCNHPYLFPGVEDRTLDPMGDHLYLNCGKMVLLHKLLKKMKERGHRVLIFSQMTRMIDILEDYLISQGYLYCRIDGNTSYEDREDRIADFNREGSDKFVFVLSTRAGGLGINLQTADTVILYDSDWNPQADLQAQDRAHRIGQKKPVQVFRLVTDETVEVKVVERAQQKLKLDAMVVQQGRLQDKEKKMSKDELLETLRFGADKVFRSKDSSITDNDIDIILEEGRKRTEQIAEQLQTAEKGDMYDFKLDGGMGTQVFEGKDYSDKAMRQQELNALAGIPFIDPGKRERKAISTYAETIARQAEREEVDKRQKIPRHLRLPRMDDWQFFDKARLQELHTEEVKLFDAMVDRGEAPQAGSISKFTQVLPDDLHAEKTRLLEQGFGDWTRVHFNSFVRATAKHGRAAHEKIAKDVGRPLDETRRYAEAFWSKGQTELPGNEWDRAIKQIEKGERRLDEISRLTTATAQLIANFEDPWEELTLRNVGNQGRIFNAVEDRFLLCLTHLHGYGNWEQVRNSVRRCERFRFDFYLQACSTDVLGKRCELLMRSAERELQEIERKRQAAESQGNGTGAAAATKAKAAASDQVKERVGELTRKIREDSKRLVYIRNSLQKYRNTGSSSGGVVSGTGGGGATVTSLKGAGGSSAGIMKAFLDAGGGGSGGGAGPVRGVQAQDVPEELYPELCRMVRDAGPDGLIKIADAFMAKHPNVSRRQTCFKINEFAFKDKLDTDKQKVWHIKPAYEYLLNIGSGGGGGSSSASKAKNPKKSTGGGGSASKSGSKASAATPRSCTGGSNSVSGGKRKHEGDTSPGTDGAGADAEPPRRFKRAFGFFVKAKRAEAEAKLGGDAKDSEALKQLLTKMWTEVDATTRKSFEKKEAEDKARYDREMKVYEAKIKTHGGSSSADHGSAAKKAKA